jgi:hypothetical protein
MGTKARPGLFDALKKAQPEEPYFVLLARDPAAVWRVLDWVSVRLDLVRYGKRPMAELPQLVEALDCAAEMVAWQVAHRPEEMTTALAELQTAIAARRRELDRLAQAFA